MKHYYAKKDNKTNKYKILDTLDLKEEVYPYETFLPLFSESFINSFYAPDFKLGISDSEDIAFGGKPEDNVGFFEFDIKCGRVKYNKDRIDIAYKSSLYSIYLLRTDYFELDSDINLTYFYIMFENLIIDISRFYNTNLKFFVSDIRAEGDYLFIDFGLKSDEGRDFIISVLIDYKNDRVMVNTGKVSSFEFPMVVNKYLAYITDILKTNKKDIPAIAQPLLVRNLIIKCNQLKGINQEVVDAFITVVLKRIKKGVDSMPIGVQYMLSNYARYHGFSSKHMKVAEKITSAIMEKTKLEPHYYVKRYDVIAGIYEVLDTMNLKTRNFTTDEMWDVPFNLVINRFQLGDSEFSNDVSACQFISVYKASLKEMKPHSFRFDIKGGYIEYSSLGMNIKFNGRQYVLYATGGNRHYFIFDNNVIASTDFGYRFVLFNIESVNSKLELYLSVYDSSNNLQLKVTLDYISSKASCEVYNTTRKVPFVTHTIDEHIKTVIDDLRECKNLSVSYSSPVNVKGLLDYIYSLTSYNKEIISQLMDEYLSILSADPERYSYDFSIRGVLDDYNKNIGYSREQKIILSKIIFFGGRNNEE